MPVMFVKGLRYIHRLNEKLNSYESLSKNWKSSKSLDLE